MCTVHHQAIIRSNSGKSPSAPLGASVSEIWRYRFKKNTHLKIVFTTWHWFYPGFNELSFVWTHRRRHPYLKPAAWWLQDIINHMPWYPTVHNATSRHCVVSTKSSTLKRHDMETFSTLLALCEGKPVFNGVSPHKRPMTRSIDVSFEVRLYKRLSCKQWSCWWYETPWGSRDATVMAWL